MHPRNWFFFLFVVISNVKKKVEKMVSINKVQQGARGRVADLWASCERLCCKYAWKNTCHTHVSQVISDNTLSLSPTNWTPLPCTISFNRLPMQFAYPQRDGTVCLPSSFIFEVLSCCLERLTIPESRQNQPCLSMSWCPFLSGFGCTKDILPFFRCFVSFQIVVSH